MATSPSATPYFRASYMHWLACLFCVTSSHLVRADDAPTPRKIGAEFRQALQAATGFTWSDRALREGLGNVAKECGVAIWLDRRIDPDRRITFSVKNQSLEASLYELVVAEHMSFTTLGSVIYVGPPEVNARLQGLLSLRRKELAALPAAIRTKWNAPCNFTWDDLAEPRTIVTQIAEKIGVKCDDPLQVPHDLWPAWRGPALTSMELLSLTLIGFDRTIKLSDDGRSFAVIPAPATFSYEETYTVPGDVVSVGKELKRILPDISLKKEGANKIIATASAEDHGKIAELLAGKKVVTKVAAKPEDKRYTLKVENQPRGAVVKTIATELGVPMKFSSDLNGKMTERVSITVKQVTADELLMQLLEPAGLRAIVSKETLEIKAK